MKVSDVMRKITITVSEDTPIKEVGRLIFSLGMTGIPVVKDNILVGIVTEQDILSKMYPTIQEVMEDYFHAQDFDSMEKNITDFLDSPVSTIMNTKVVTANSDTPLMRAQSLMLTHKFSRLPIVSEGNQLLGIITQGDIFRQLLKDEIPKLEQERYAGLIGTYYDEAIDWGKRLKAEFPALFRLLRDNNVKTIIDMGVWTGNYTVEMIKEWDGDKILGLDHNPVMINIAEGKRGKLPPALKQKVNFMLTDFTNLSSLISEKYDCALFVGSSLPYIATPMLTLFKDLAKCLRDENAVIFSQTINFQKIMNTRNRLISFFIQKSQTGPECEHLFIEFFDEKKTGEFLTHHVIIFDYDGINWIFKGITSVPERYIVPEDLTKALKDAGFSKVSLSGNKGEYLGTYGELSLTQPFDPLESDFLNVVAQR